MTVSRQQASAAREPQLTLLYAGSQTTLQRQMDGPVVGWGKRRLNGGICGMYQSVGQPELEREPMPCSA
jgi:hypothetical protein